MCKRILLCDDEIYILRAAEFKLKEAGYDVEITNNGEEAWEAIQKQKPDLLIVDYHMPRLNGIDLVRRMRADPNTKNIPVFLLTCNLYAIAPEILTDELHFDNVISKPFSPRGLLRDVNSTLQDVAGKV